MTQLQAQWVPDGADQLLCVICDNEKDDPFPDAANLMQTVLQVDRGWSSIALHQWTIDDPEAPRQLQEHMISVDKTFGEKWRVFGLATVETGRFNGIRAVGLGSNKQRIQRSAAIALVLSALSRDRGLVTGDSILLKCLRELPRPLPISGSYSQPLPPPPPPPLAPAGVRTPRSDSSSASERVILCPSSPATVCPPRTVSVAMAWLNNGVEGQSVCASDQTPLVSDSRDGSSEGREDPGDMVVMGLQRKRGDDCHTIRTLNSADTIPLGTDLDPVNGYRNLWAANQVTDPSLRDLKALVQCDLNKRVLDAENIGFSYGREVENWDKRYIYEGVRRAIWYFLQHKLEVIVVAKRNVEDLKQEFGDAVKVIVAEKTDDAMILNHAYSLNCPIVSRDCFETWKNDFRLAAIKREWMKNIAERIQVRFSWGEKGAFVPDFDLLTCPVLCPSNGGPASMCWKCRQGRTEGGVSERWREQTFWRCDSCLSTRKPS